MDIELLIKELKQKYLLKKNLAENSVLYIS